ncbi:MAG: hypothetical protein IIC13_06055, partial [SAR324 cluster bacterium]|nr:hypothetical protein [SAR324 cluster bacterium]
MKHPKVKINLADALNGKNTNERPLAVGDKLRNTTWDARHCIYGQGRQDNVVCGVNVTEASAWLNGFVSVKDKNSLTESEALGLIEGTLDPWARIAENGSETPLADIYAERFEVGVGNYLVRTGTEQVSLICVDENGGCIVRAWPSDRYIAHARLEITQDVDKSSLTEPQLKVILSACIHDYDVLPLADALA